MTVIRIITEDLAARESRLRLLTTSFSLAMMHEFNAPPVDEAYDHVHEQWMESQVEISGAVDHIANILKMIRQAFDGIDVQFASSLEASLQGGAQ